MSIKSRFNAFLYSVMYWHGKLKYKILINKLNFIKMINQLAKKIHENSKSKGFYENEKNIGEMLALIHSEVSEALEADRKTRYCELDNENWNIDKHTLRDDLKNFDNIQFLSTFKIYVKDTFEDELADVMIRVMDLAEHKGIDLEAHIEAKMRYNSLREHKHGKKY